MFALVIDLRFATTLAQSILESAIFHAEEILPAIRADNASHDANIKVTKYDTIERSSRIVEKYQV